MTPFHYTRWVNPEKMRYYEARLHTDLFGEWVVVKSWGGCGSRLGGVKSGPVPSYEAGVEALKELGIRRRRRGYQQTACVEPSRPRLVHP